MELAVPRESSEACPYVMVWPHITADDVESVRLILDAQRSLDHDPHQCLDCQYACCLCHAMQQGEDHPNCVLISRMLIEAGSDVNLHDANDNDVTPLHCAARSNYLAMEKVQLLLSHGADVNRVNSFGHTALHLAARNTSNAPEMVKYLLSRGAEPDVEDADGCTPLFEAVFAGARDNTQALIAAGCDLDVLNGELLTPLDYAVTYQQLDIVPLLLVAGCRTTKDNGHNYYKEHYCNQLLYSLLAKKDMDNIYILLECCYVSYEAWVARMVDGAYLGARGMITPLPLMQTVIHTTKQLLQNPKSLRTCCRINVRNILINKRRILTEKVSLEKLIYRLPLPKLICRYLAFQNEGDLLNGTTCPRISLSGLRVDPAT